jgi:hypothetical protein
MNRNSRASLSPHERAISGKVLRLPLEMKLAVKDGERIDLSPAGRARLRAGGPRPPVKKLGGPPGWTGAAARPAGVSVSSRVARLLAVPVMSCGR